MANRQPKILLLDANALVHRSYHALPPLTSPKGEQVNAVYGFAAALLKALQDEKPDYAVACFDAGKETFRNELYDGYKAHRKESEEALSMQFPRVKDLVECLSIPLFAQKGVEADDLIGSLSQIAGKQGLQVVIVTGDNDALQLVNDSTSVYSLRRGVTDTLSYNRHLVKEKLGVYPEQVVDYKALAGDNSDNIPGAPGIGPKTASDWLSKYQNLEGLYDHLDELSERQRQILTENKDQVLLSRKLAQIKTDLDIELNLDKAKVSNFDFDQAVSFFHELGFRSLLSKLPKAETKVQATLFAVDSEPKIEQVVAQLPYEAVETVEKWQQLYQTLKKQPKLVIDTETIDLEGELIGIAFGWGPNEAAYLPLSPNYPDGLPIEKIRSQVNDVLIDKQIKKIGHNIKYDLWVLRQAGFEVGGVWFDTMLASNLINTQLFSHKLDDIAFSELGFRKISITQLIGAKKDVSMAKVPLDTLAAYSCEDALITWRLYEKFYPDLEEQSLKKIFYEIEMPLLPVLEEMEETGVKLDLPYLEKLGQTLRSRLTKIEKEILQQAGSTFNIASPTQLQEVLFQRLNLPIAGIKKTKSGFSTDIDTLLKLRDKHPIIPLIMEHRELSKLLSTYIETLPKLADKKHRVHTTFQQLGAATGRLASTNPNLQNIPIRTELGNEVRRAFIAEQGCVLLGADYSQAELRILAHISQDPGLIQAFHDQSDFHAAVAEQMNVDRRTAKAINFGIVYGLGANGLANDLGITPTEAREFIDRYFQKFSGVTAYIERMRRLARDQGYVQTIFGRKRFLPDIHSPNMAQRAAAERMAINMPPQGTVADLMKLSMVRIAEELFDGAKMLLQIHDELLFEVEKEKAEQLAKLVKEVMGSVIELKVPMVVDVKTGPNWADMTMQG